MTIIIRRTDVEVALNKSVPEIPSKSRSLYLVGDGDFCGMGIENILPSEKIGDALPPALESKPFLLSISLFI